MKSIFTFSFTLLLLVLGCKHGAATSPTSSPLQTVDSGDAKPTTSHRVVVGMSMTDVIKVCGRHYKSFEEATFGQSIMLYDDVSVYLKGTWPGTTNGVVYSVVVPQDHSMADLATKIPYEDSK